MQQPANGIHLIGVEVSPAAPAAGEEVCVVLTTPLESGSLNVLISVGSSTVFNGPPPLNKEVCIQTSSEDAGEAFQVTVTSTQGSGLSAFGSGDVVLS
ncbi:MAG: hypothetical protein RL885_03800 [Planctomycetota bacterium]